MLFNTLTHTAVSYPVFETSLQEFVPRAKATKASLSKVPYWFRCWITKSYLKTPEMMRWNFFSEDLPEDDMQRWTLYLFSTRAASDSHFNVKQVWSCAAVTAVILREGNLLPFSPTVQTAHSGHSRSDCLSRPHAFAHLQLENSCRICLMTAALAIMKQQGPSNLRFLLEFFIAREEIAELVAVPRWQANLTDYRYDRILVIPRTWGRIYTKNSTECNSNSGSSIRAQCELAGFFNWFLSSLASTCLVYIRNYVSISLYIHIQHYMFELMLRTLENRRNTLLPSTSIDHCRYFELLTTKQSSIPALDVSNLSKELEGLGKAPKSLPVLVMGAENDMSVDLEGVEETAAYYGTEPILIPNMGHDMMLVCFWHSRYSVVGFDSLYTDSRFNRCPLWYW